MIAHEDYIISQTKHWLTSFIIKYNICPFAKKEFDRGSIRFAVIKPAGIEQCLESVIKECQTLISKVEIETSLLIFPNQFNQFNNYLDFLSLAESLLVEQGYEGVFQLASFHPDYCFEGSDDLDPANYTNRSPYPMLHLIREASLEHALSTYPNPEKIPERNIQLTQKMGLKKVQSILSHSIKLDT